MSELVDAFGRPFPADTTPPDAAANALSITERQARARSDIEARVAQRHAIDAAMAREAADMAALGWNDDDLVWAGLMPMLHEVGDEWRNRSEAERREVAHKAAQVEASQDLPPWLRDWGDMEPFHIVEVLRREGVSREHQAWALLSTGRLELQTILAAVGVSSPTLTTWRSKFAVVVEHDSALRERLSEQCLLQLKSPRNWAKARQAAAARQAAKESADE